MQASQRGKASGSALNREGLLDKLAAGVKVQNPGSLTVNCSIKGTHSTKWQRAAKKEREKQKRTAFYRRPFEK